MDKRVGTLRGKQVRYICGSLSIAIEKPVPFVTINGVFHSLVKSF